MDIDLDFRANVYCFIIYICKREVKDITELTNRQRKLVEILIDEDDYMAVRFLSDKLNISRKTVYRDIEKIESIMPSISFDKKQGSGIKIIVNSDSLVRKPLKNIEKYSVEERRIKIFLWLLQHSKKYTSICYLSDRFYVGRTSIISDLNYINTNLLGDKLTIEKSKNGTRILGKEEDVRSKLRYVLENYSFVNTEDVKPYKSDRMDENTIKAIQSKYPLEDIITIESIIKKYEKNLPYTIGDLYYTNMIVHILIAIDRVRLEKYVEPSNSIKKLDVLFYKQAKNIAEDVEQSFNVKFPESEVTYIYKYLTSMGVGKLNTVDSERWIDNSIDDISTEFLRYLLEDHVVDFNKNQHVFYAFQLHIRALIQRLKYRIEIKNPLTKTIKSNYPEVFSYMKSVSAKVLENEISEDEIAYLTVYIQSLLENQISMKKIVIVCHSGFGTSLLLKKRILANFDKIEVVDILSSDDLADYDLDAIDYVVSTVKLLDVDFENILYVSTLLLKDDIEKINRIIMGAK